MPRQVTTVTPENVRIEYELAGVASRSAATLLDVLIQAGAMLVLLIVFLILQLTGTVSITSWPTAVLVVTGFLLWFGYFLYFEAAWNGQTPGKKALRLRAVKYGGAPIDLPCAAVRSLVRVIDLAFLIGFVSILVTARSQRLGDFAAGTLVVRERSEWTGDLQQPKQVETHAYPEAELVRNVELVTPEQFEMAKRFVERSDELQPQVREQLAGKIALPLMQHLGIEPGPAVVYSRFLAAVYDKCVRDRGMR